MSARSGTTGIRAFTTLGLVTGILLVVRLWLDGHLELMFDEAYYALWARHLAWGYFDHPPMVALWIRLSTICFGDHEFGVRALGTLAATAGTGLVYLVTWHLFTSRETAIFAALLYCAMLLISAGAIIITPDTPLVFFWSIALYALVRIFCGGGSGWWWIVGIAMGLALQSKYTAILLGAGIVCAMAVVPRLRHWWRHPMPYVAGVLTLAIFAPVVAWNYQHGWASFGRQFGRAQVDGLSLRFLAEFLGSQVGLVTPFVFVLAAGGVWLALRRHRDEINDTNLFLVSLIGLLLVYFLFHSLHARVQGNWVAPAYPVLAVLGAQAAYQRRELPTRMQGAIALSRRLAVPGWPCTHGDRLPASSRRPHPARSRKRPHSFDGRMGPFRRTSRRRRRGYGGEVHPHIPLCADERVEHLLPWRPTDHSIQRAHTLALVRNASALCF